jgi:hypothetical protein
MFGDVENLIDRKVKQVFKNVVSSNLVLFKWTCCISHMASDI